MALKEIHARPAAARVVTSVAVLKSFATSRCSAPSLSERANSAPRAGRIPACCGSTSASCGSAGSNRPNASHAYDFPSFPSTASTYADFPANSASSQVIFCAVSLRGVAAVRNTCFVAASISRTALRPAARSPGIAS